MSLATLSESALGALERGEVKQAAAAVQLVHKGLTYLDQHAVELAKVWQRIEGKTENPDLRMLLLWAADRIPHLEAELADEVDRREAAEATLSEVSRRCVRYPGCADA